MWDCRRRGVREFCRLKKRGNWKDETSYSSGLAATFSPRRKAKNLRTSSRQKDPIYKECLSSGFVTLTVTKPAFSSKRIFFEGWVGTSETNYDYWTSSNPFSPTPPPKSCLHLLKLIMRRTSVSFWEFNNNRRIYVSAWADKSIVLEGKGRTVWLHTQSVPSRHLISE